MKKEFKVIGYQEAFDLFNKLLVITSTEKFYINLYNAEWNMAKKDTSTKCTVGYSISNGMLSRLFIMQDDNLLWEEGDLLGFDDDVRVNMANLIKE